MTQNTSHAVMSQRTESAKSLDDFPTPPWATRALIKYGIPKHSYSSSMTCLEPATGRGYMSATLNEYFQTVFSSDIHNYGYGEVQDFLSEAYKPNSYDWVISNPPFRLAEDFVKIGLAVARVGVAMLVRTVFIESVGRYNRLFNITPPVRMAQFVERVPMVKGRVDKNASTATGYCWLIWLKEHTQNSELTWIPACRKQLERPDDYTSPLNRDN